MPRRYARAVLFATIWTAGCATAAGRSGPYGPAQAPARVDVELDTGEPDAALTIIRKHVAGDTPSPEDWQRVFRSRGYAALKEREAFMRRSFTDSSFARFLMSDTLASRAAPLAHSLAGLKRIEVTTAAARALAYLPAGTPLRARLYLEIKPITNSFVFTGRDSTPAIFLYVNPAESAAQVENVMAHELHHIGLTAACANRRSAASTLTPAQTTLLDYLSAFGEGEAMLAAAGGPEIHPHATDPDSIRLRWDADVARASVDMQTQSTFFAAVLEGRIASSDSVRAIANTFFGVQGPWYTVGWVMAATIEREFGRGQLLAVLCDPIELMMQYNAAAHRANARGENRPLWDASLLARLQGLIAFASDGPLL